MKRKNVIIANTLLIQINKIEDILELKNWDNNRYNLCLKNHNETVYIPDNIIIKCRDIILDYFKEHLTELEKELEELD